MERINEIMNHRTYQDYLSEIAECEKDRIFCRHHTAHFMDVARIGYILCLEENLSISKERIYAAALLHDIGRYEQYKRGTPHQEASALIAPDILRECHFAPDEVEEIVAAIREHGNKQVSEQRDLTGILYRADKLSRGCYGCEAEKSCNWSDDKKNLKILY